MKVSVKNGLGKHAVSYDLDVMQIAGGSGRHYSARTLHLFKFNPPTNAYLSVAYDSCEEAHMGSSLFYTARSADES